MGVCWSIGQLVGWSRDQSGGQSIKATRRLGDYSTTRLDDYFAIAANAPNAGRAVPFAYVMLNADFSSPGGLL